MDPGVFFPILHESLKGLYVDSIVTNFSHKFQFLAFESFSELAWTITPSSSIPTWQPVTHFLCGSLAGSVATVTMQPLDVIRTRFVAQGNKKVGK